MGKIIDIALVLASLYFGINWGVEQAASPGGKVVMSIVGVVGLLIVCIILELFFLIVTSSRDESPLSHRVRYRSPAERAADAEDAIAAYKERDAAKVQALASGMTIEEFDAQQAEADRQDELRRAQDFSQKVRSTEPLRPLDG